MTTTYKATYLTAEFDIVRNGRSAGSVIVSGKTTTELINAACKSINGYTTTEYLNDGRGDLSIHLLGPVREECNRCYGKGQVPHTRNKLALKTCPDCKGKRIA